MATQLGTYNKALFEISEAKLSSLSENRETRRVLDEYWTVGVYTCLQAASWNFASRTVRIDHDAAITPSFGYRYVFQHPSDWLRTIGISADEYLSLPLERYKDEGARWLSDADPIYVQYVSNDASYGMDLSLWPPNFELYVAAYLASLIAPRVRESKQKEMIQLARLRFSKAAAVEALGQPAEAPPPGRFVMARAGGYSRRDRGNRGSLIG